MTPLLSIEHLSKTFGVQRVLDDVAMTVGRGEIVSIVGQNGSGKSTLIKILAGVHTADPGGTVLVGDQPLGSRTQGVGLHFIHQDLGLIPMLSAAENLSLGRDGGSAALRNIDKARERATTTELIEQFGGTFDVTRPVATLSAAERTIVAIARALRDWTSDDNILVLDEPTASLHGTEAAKLFDVIRRVRDRGAGVILVSHRLSEVLDLSDRVVVLRDGRVVGTRTRAELNHDDLVELLAGRRLEDLYTEPPSHGAEVALRVTGLIGSVISGVDLTLHVGEIVGVTGLLGSGREELAALLFGSAPSVRDSYEVSGRRIDRLDPRAAIGAGVGFVPADRVNEGAAMGLSVRENMTMGRMTSFWRHGWLRLRTERAEVHSWIASTQLRPAEPERALALLSGGNQQKAVLAKWLRLQPSVLLLDEPTQGVDVGAKATIFALIAQAAEAGTAVLVSSGDVKDLSETCDRVIVLRDGRVGAIVARDDLSETRLVRESLGSASGSSTTHDAELSSTIRS